MKKLIAILLTLTLVMGMLPMAWAAEKNAEVHDNQYKYVFSADAYVDMESTTSAEVMKNLRTTATNPDVSDQWNLMYRGIHWMHLKDAEDGSGILWTASATDVDAKVNTVAIKINIAEAGTYVPTLTYSALPTGAIYDIYITENSEKVDAIEDITASKNRTIVQALCNESNFIGTLDTYSVTEAETSVVLDSVTVDTAGEYLLVLRANGYNEKIEHYVSSNKKYVRGEIKSLELTKDINADAIANGELEYVLGTEALNTDKMYVHGSKTGAYITEGLREATTLQYWSYADWKKTSTLGPKDSDGNPTTVDAYPTMNITDTGTDPWKMDSELDNSTGIVGFISTMLNSSNGKGLNGTMKIGNYYNATTSQPGTNRPYFAIRVNIPYAGKYTMEMKGQKALQGAVTDVRFGKTTSDERLSRTAATELEIVGTYYGNTEPTDEQKEAGYATSAITTTDTSLKYGNAISVEAPEAGEYWIVFDTSKAAYDANPYYVDATSDYQGFYLSGIRLTPVKEDSIKDFDIAVTDDTLVAGESADISATVTWTAAGASAYTSPLTYSSSRETVATVDTNGKITALCGGTTLITATTADGEHSSVMITVTDKSTEKGVSYAIANNLDDKYSVYSVSRGDTVTVTAESRTGYTFRHWVRGTAEKGEWISAAPTYSFDIASNIYLTAVYTPVTDEKIVEFFNENREYITEAKVNADGTVTLPETNPKRTGFKFLKWLLSETEELTESTVLTEKITRAVARYEDSGERYTVTIPTDSSETLSTTDTYAYDAEIELTAPYSVYWYRNDEQVAYGTSYTYYVWDDAVIETSTAGLDVPTVVLDADVKEENAYMIEYYGSGEEIVEVGIIFGDGTQTIESCDWKATSKTPADHGQFTAKPAPGGSTGAKGYLIYNDNGTHRVVYSD